MLDASHYKAWQKLEGISLDEMSAVKLMNRIDTKYVVSSSLLEEILLRMSSDYYVQKINDNPISTYDTIYYDTPSCAMYICHHNKKLIRQKVRTREYLSSNLAFLEIKRKTNKGRTKKKRIEIPVDELMDFKLDEKAVNFLNEKSDFKSFEVSPKVRTHFDRITLVNRRKTERLTIDFNLIFENFVTGKKVALPEMMIIELKQDGLQYSEMKAILSDMRITSNRISKYCIGTVLTDDKIKKNRFLPKVRLIEKITGRKFNL